MALVADSVRAKGLTFTYDQAGSDDAVALCLHGFPEAGSPGATNCRRSQVWAGAL